MLAEGLPRYVGLVDSHVCLHRRWRRSLFDHGHPALLLRHDRGP